MDSLTGFDEGLAVFGREQKERVRDQEQGQGLESATRFKVVKLGTGSGGRWCSHMHSARGPGLARGNRVGLIAIP